MDRQVVKITDANTGTVATVTIEVEGPDANMVGEIFQDLYDGWSSPDLEDSGVTFEVVGE